jgi:hypothetical protein
VGIEEENDTDGGRLGLRARSNRSRDLPHHRKQDGYIRVAFLP